MSRRISWSGYTWNVRSCTEVSLPGDNVFSDSSELVSVADDALILSIAPENGVWKSSEVVLEGALGYGTYSVSLVTPISQIPHRAVLGMFLYASDSAEVDIEISPAMVGKNKVQFAVQPARFFNRSRRHVPDTGNLTLSISWRSSGVDFLVVDESGTPIASWRKKYEMAEEGAVKCILNYWLFQANTLPETSTLQFRNFTYRPH